MARPKKVSHRVAVPFILGLGLLALFTLENFSPETEDWYGNTETVDISFSEMWNEAQTEGEEWIITVAFVGIAMAIVAALFEGMDSRRWAMGVGALLGLFYPLGWYLTGALEGVSLGGFFGSFGLGMSLYWLMCIVASASGFSAADNALVSNSDSLPLESKSDTAKSTPLVAAKQVPQTNAASPASGHLSSDLSSRRVRTIVQTKLQQLPEDEAPFLADIAEDTVLLTLEPISWEPRTEWMLVKDEQSGLVGYIDGYEVNPE